MKQLLLFFLLMGTLWADKSSVAAMVISENGLTIRETPTRTGKEICTVPFLEKVTLLEIKRKERKFELITSQENRKQHHTSSPSRSTYGYSPKIGRKYGNWQKVSWKEKEGWAFNAWLLQRQKPYVTNLHYLNELPQTYFFPKKDEWDEKSGRITSQCQNGLETLSFHLHHPFTEIEHSGTNSPHIYWRRGENSAIFTILSVESHKGVYHITAQNNYQLRLEKKSIPNTITISIEKRNNHYLLAEDIVGKLFSIDTFSDTLYQKCE